MVNRTTAIRYNTKLHKVESKPEESRPMQNRIAAYNQRLRQRDRQKDSQPERERERQRQRDRDRETERQTDRDRETDGETDGEREGGGGNKQQPKHNCVLALNCLVHIFAD